MIHIIKSIALMLASWIVGIRLISTRCACLGNECLTEFRVINRQKFRVDMPWKRSPVEALNVLFVAKYFIKSNIYNLVTQQSFNLWVYSLKNSQFFIMDTYSELTDRSYIFKSARFCCHRSDLKEKYKTKLNSGAQLNELLISVDYRSFFTRLRKINPTLKIIVILFPVKFDNRERYRLQYDLIKRSLEVCSDMEIKVIELEDSKIHKDPGDEYPYHFDPETIDNFKSLVLKAMEKP